MKALITLIVLMMPVVSHAESWADRNVHEHDAYIAAEIASIDQVKADRERRAVKESAELDRWIAEGRNPKCFFVVCGGVE